MPVFKPDPLKKEDDGFGDFDQANNDVTTFKPDPFKKEEDDGFGDFD